MNFIDRFQVILILLSAVLGLLFGHIHWVSNHSHQFIAPFLIAMLTIVFLNTPFKGIKGAFKNVRFTGLSLAVNFLWTPFLAWIIGMIFLKEQPDLWVGFLMLLATPCTDWYLVFTQMARGNVTLAATLLPWHLILQLILLPLYLFLLAGKLIPISIDALLQSVFLVLLLPFFLSVLLDNVLCKTKGKNWFHDKFLNQIPPFQVLFLCLAIMAMFSSQGEVILKNPLITFKLIPPLLIFYGVNLLIGRKLSRAAGIDRASSIGFCFATLARNSPLALAIALTAFPERPLIALALVIGSLVELPTLALIANYLKKSP